jgi:hypothetical protein
MNNSTTRKLTRFKYAAVLLGGLAAVVFAPATAYAVDNEDPAGPGGCHYTDADGYDIPIHNGEDVYVDGKIVSCRNGEIIVTNPPARGSVLRPQFVDPNLPTLTETGTSRPETPRPPLVNSNAPVLTATP